MGICPVFFRLPSVKPPVCGSMAASVAGVATACGYGRKEPLTVTAVIRI